MSVSQHLLQGRSWLRTVSFDMIIYKEGRILVADLLSDGMDSVKIILVVVMINVMVKGYTVKYNDCRKPKQIFKYATDGLCDNVIGKSKGKTYMSVVQKVAETKLMSDS